MVRQRIPKDMLMIIRFLSLLLLDPGKNARNILKNVMETQYILGKTVAPFASVTLDKVAKDEIHPANVISIPRQKNIRMHREYSRDLETALGFYFLTGFSSF